MSEDLHWLAVADGVSPLARGWSQNSGATGPLVATLGFTPSNSGTDDAYVVRRLIPDDPYRFGPARDRDTVELQWRFQGVSQAPAGGWAALGVHVAFIDDGVRVLGICQGTRLQWVDPYTGAVLGTIATAWAWQSERTLLFTKIGAERWQCWHDGTLLGELAYDAAPASTPLSVITPTAFGNIPVLWSSARVGWGRLNTAGTGTGRWDRIELGTNLAVPREWKVARVRSTIAGPIQRVWNSRWEAQARTIIGEAQQAQNALDRAWPLTTEGRVLVEAVYFTGEKLPQIEDTRWAVIGTSGDLTIQNERVRIAGANSDNGVRYTVASTTNANAEYRARAVFRVDASTSRDREGRIGPFLEIRNGHRRITASLLWAEASQSYGWLIHDGAVSGAALGTRGEVFWPVNPWVDHSVELRVLGRSRVILFVDDVLVDDVPYDRFSSAIGTRTITIGRGDDADIQVVVSMSHGAAEVSYTDARTRPAFLQAMAEKLVFVGGREPNHRLAAWGDLYPGVHRRRGSLIGLRTEYRRIAGHDDVDIHATRDPAGWFLNRTFPQITPVYLNAKGDLVDAILEFYNDIPNYTPEAFCKLIHRYLAPISTLEMQLFCALITDLTSSTVTSGTTTFDVEDPRGFEVGDAVSLRGTTSGTVATIDYAAEGAMTSADAAWVAVEPDGTTSGRFRIDAEGLGELEYTGTFTAAGLDGDKDANHPGGTVQVVGAAANVDCLAFVFGILSKVSPGDPDVAGFERIHAVGTTPAQGVVSFGTIFGMILNKVQVAAVKVQSTTGATQLYVVNSGHQAVGGGCLSFWPDLHGAPGKWGIKADGATVQKVLVFGVRETPEVFGGEVVTLNGTTLVETATSFAQVRAVCLGYVEAARTLTFSTLGSDRTADVTLQSSSASDTQTYRVIGMDLDGEVQIRTGVLNGTTLVTLSGPRWYRVLGVLLSKVAVGTITIRMQNGDGPTVPTLQLMQIAPGQQSAGGHIRSIPCAGHVRVSLNQGATTVRYIAVCGRRADTGQFGADLFAVGGTEWLEGRVDFTEIQFIATGHLPNTKYLKIEGTSWFSETLHDAAAAIGGMSQWTIGGIADDQAILTYLRPDRGAQTKLRDMKSPRHSVNLTGWPIRYPASLAGTAPLLLQVVENAGNKVPTVQSRPLLVDTVRYEVDNLAAFSTWWNAGNFSIFCRVRVNNSAGTSGLNYLVKATAGATGNGFRMTGLVTLSLRYNSVVNSQSMSINDGLFHSVAVVMTGFVSQLYVDGLPVGGTTNHVAGGAAAVAQLFQNQNSTQFLDYADLALYRRPLTSAEVLLLHQDTSGNDALRIDKDLWAHYLDPHRDAATAYEGAPVAVPGRYDTTESTTILAIDETTNEIETDPITGTFNAGAVMRKILD